MNGVRLWGAGGANWARGWGADGPNCGGTARYGVGVTHTWGAGGYVVHVGGQSRMLGWKWLKLGGWGERADGNGVEMGQTGGALRDGGAQLGVGEQVAPIGGRGCSHCVQCCCGAGSDVGGWGSVGPGGDESLWGNGSAGLWDGGSRNLQLGTAALWGSESGNLWGGIEMNGAESSTKRDDRPSLPSLYWC